MALLIWRRVSAIDGDKRVVTLLTLTTASMDVG